MAGAPVPVVVEAGGRRTFAAAVDWPGWCRAGRDEAAALESLAAAAPRYAAVAAAAGMAFPAGAATGFEVVERLEGDASTDFGVPGAVAAADRAPVTPADGARMAALLEAAWATLDAVAATAPESLRKGPRGGGRDRDAVVAHVVEAEGAYARKVGIRVPRPHPGDAAGIAVLRRAVTATLAGTRPPDEDPGWPLRYAARRFAWHVLDHAWEIEDRSG